MRHPLVVPRFYAVRAVEVRPHRFTRTTWKANATRITKPVSAARTMYVRVLTASPSLRVGLAPRVGLSPRVRALSIRFVGAVFARGEAIAEPPAYEPRDP